MPFGMGFGELVLILVIVMVVFGATKLPQLGDGLGRAIKNFKRSVGSLNEIDVTPRTDAPPESTSEAKPDAGPEKKSADRKPPGKSENGPDAPPK
jgi:sec-independent protein translocase protein TatA